jgi:hypothetical protein
MTPALCSRPWRSRGLLDVVMVITTLIITMMVITIIVITMLVITVVPLVGAVFRLPGADTPGDPVRPIVIAGGIPMCTGSHQFDPT